jgi:hypothetical protein
VLLFATVVLLNGETVMRWIGDHLGLGRTATLVWMVVQYPLAIGSVVALLWLQYYFLPNCRHQGKRYVWVGATVAAVLWLLATLLFRLYVQKFHALNPAYGAIGAIMVLLTWMYYSSFVLLAAGELNSELQTGTGRADAPGRTASDGDGRRAAKATPGRGSMARGKPGRGAIAGAAPGRGSIQDERHVAPTPGAERVAPRGVAASPVHLDERGIGNLMRDLATGAATLLREQLVLIRLELTRMARAVGFGTALVATGGVLALLGLFSTLAGLAFLAADQWLRDRYWLGALAITMVAGGLALWLMARGRRALSPARLAPTQTVETVREDLAVLRAALRSRGDGESRPAPVAAAPRRD